MQSTRACFCGADGVPQAKVVFVSGRLPSEEFSAAHQQPFALFFNSSLYLHNVNIYIHVYQYLGFNNFVYFQIKHKIPQAEQKILGCLKI